MPSAHLIGSPISWRFSISRTSRPLSAASFAVIEPRRPPSRHYDIVAVFQSPLPPREQLKFCCQPFIRSGGKHGIVGIFFMVGLPYL